MALQESNNNNATGGASRSMFASAVASSLLSENVMDLLNRRASQEYETSAEQWDALKTQWLETFSSAATKRSYAFCEGRFRKFIEGRYEGELPFLSRVRKKDLVAYKNSTIQEGGIKNETRQTARLHFSGAKSFLAFCRGEGDVPGMCDFSGIKAPTTMCNSNTKNALTPDQVACLFQVCRFFPESHERLLVLLYHGALRVNEATHIRIKDLKLEGQCFKVKVDAAFAKRSKERTIKLTEWATAQIVEFWREHRNEEELKLVKVTPKTCNIWLRNMARKAREIYPSIVPEEMTKKISNHVLRHSFASHFLREKGPEHLVRCRDHLGHASITVTNHYLHSWDE